jgi:CubicO group peptidase (beta-lactamase class C family)
MKKIMATLCLLAGLLSKISARSTSQKLDQLMSAYAKNREFNGSVLIARSGKILLEKGYGFRNQEKNLNNTSATRYPVASITKTFTATLIVKLAELKLLSLQDRLNKYYPDYPLGDSITIEHLLTHTAGIYNYTEDNDFMYNQSDKHVSEQKMLSLFKNKPLDFPPGTGWKYSNSGYNLLGFIIEKVTKMSYYAAIRKYIFTPLAMVDSGFDFVSLPVNQKALGYYSDAGKDYTKKAPLEDSSVVFAAGAIYSTVGDLYKWHQALQKNQIISKASSVKANTPFRENYGYGWIIDSLYQKRIISHSGGLPGYRSNFVRIVADDLCIILLNNTEIPGLKMITDNLLAVLYNQPYKIPVLKEAIKLDDAILKQYVGRFEVEAQKLVIEFKIENNTLIAYPVNGPRSVLSPLTENRFFDSEQEAIEIAFEKDPSGKFNKLILDFNGNIRTGHRLP